MDKQTDYPKGFVEIAKDVCKNCDKYNIPFPDSTIPHWIRFLLNPTENARMVSNDTDCHKKIIKAASDENKAMLNSVLRKWASRNLCYFNNFQQYYSLDWNTTFPEYIADLCTWDHNLGYLLSFQGGNLNNEDSSLLNYVAKMLRKYIKYEENDIPSHKISTSQFKFKARPGSIITLISTAVEKKDILGMSVTVSEAGDTSTQMSSYTYKASPGLQYTTSSTPCKKGRERTITMVVKKFPNNEIPVGFLSGCDNLIKVILSDDITCCRENNFTDRCNGLKSISIMEGCEILDSQDFSLDKVKIITRYHYCKVSFNDEIGIKTDDDENRTEVDDWSRTEIDDWSKTEVDNDKDWTEVDNDKDWTEVDNDKDWTETGNSQPTEEDYKNDDNSTEKERREIESLNPKYSTFATAYKNQALNSAFNDSLYLVSFAVMPDCMKADLVYSTYFGWPDMPTKMYTDLDAHDKNGNFKLQIVLTRIRNKYPSQCKTKSGKEKSDKNWYKFRSKCFDEYRKTYLVINELFRKKSIIADDNDFRYRCLKEIVVNKRSYGEVHEDIKISESKLRKSMANWIKNTYEHLYPNDAVPQAGAEGEAEERQAKK